MRSRLLVILAVLQVLVSPVFAASGIVPIGVKDASGNPQNFNVYSTTGLLSGNLMWNNAICDVTTLTQCAAVDASGRLTALSVQSGTWNIGTVTTLTTITNPVAATESGTWNITNVSGTVSLPTGAATSAFQATNTGTTAHTCSVAGFSELGCLGQIDDDVNGTKPRNVSQFGGTNVVTGTGAGGAGIPRVTISNDSSLAANQSVNVSQFGGSNAVTGTGTSGAGIPRVTISNDSSLAANQSVNLNQISGAGIGITNPIWAGNAQAGATTMQSAATGNGNGVATTASGYATAIVNVNCSVACSGGTTVNFEGTDATGNFFAVAAYPIGGGAAVNAVTNLATSAMYVIPVAGLTSIRARISAYSAGTITVTGTPNAGSAALAGSASVTGSASNASSGVATSSSNIGSVAYNYGFNGTTWDQIKSTSNSMNIAMVQGGNTQTVNSNSSALIDANTSSQIHSDLISALPAGTNQIGTVGIMDANNNRALVDPCQSVAKATTPISQTASTRIVTGTSAKKTYVCSMLAVSSTGDTLNLIEGTGSTCGTGSAAVVGSTTAANGMTFSAGGGFGSGGGGYASLGTATNADDLCLTQSGSSRVAGYVTWVQQ